MILVDMSVWSDHLGNAYTPGAGTPPPELAGRSGLREQVRLWNACGAVDRPRAS